MQLSKQISTTKWYVMAAVAMGVFLATIDGSIVNIALPTLATALNVDFAVVEWVVLGYLLTMTTLMLGVGRFADMIGKKKIYSAGFVVFTLGSVLCGFSTSIGMLIICRVLQAIGAAMMVALGTAIVTEAFPPSERGMALGIMGTVVSIGIIAGPTIGGFLLGGLSWHWLFFVNVPVGIVGVFMAVKYVPEIRPPGGERFDFRGAFVLFVGLLTLLLGLSISQKEGFGNLTVVGLLVTAILSLVFFAFLELRIAQPMIDLRLFKNGLFSVNLMTGFLTFVGTSGTVILMPFYLQNILQFPPQQSGLLLGVVPLMVGLVAPISGRLSDRVGPRPLTALGLFLLMIGFFAVSSLDASTNALGYALRFIPVGLGLGLFQSPNNSAVMGTAPKNRLGVVSGLLSITRTMGQTAGIAILGSIWAGRVGFYTGTLSNDVTKAPVQAQISALHDTMLVVVGLMLFGLVLSLWALYTVTIKKPAAR